MSSVKTLGLELRLALQRLQRQHGVTPTPCILPLAPATPGPVLVEGRATTGDVDRDRTRIRAYCLGYPLPRYCRGVPLLFRHEAKQPAGEILDLSYDERGALKVFARVTHPVAARCGAFSVTLGIDAFALHDADSPAFYAQVNQARLIEISLTSGASQPGSPRDAARAGAGHQRVL